MQKLSLLWKSCSCLPIYLLALNAYGCTVNFPARAGKRQVLLSPTAEAVEDPSAPRFVHPLWEDPPNNKQVVPKVSTQAGLGDWQSFNYPY